MMNILKDGAIRQTDLVHQVADVSVSMPNLSHHRNMITKTKWTSSPVSKCDETMASASKNELAGRENSINDSQTYWQNIANVDGHEVTNVHSLALSINEYESARDKVFSLLPAQEIVREPSTEEINSNQSIDKKDKENPTFEEIDLDQDDELMSLSTGPSSKSSPANTLDSFNSSLEAYDIGKTEFSSFSSFSSIISVETDGPSLHADETDNSGTIHDEFADGGKAIVMVERSRSTCSQDSGIEIKRRTKKKGYNFTSFLSKNIFFHKGKEETGKEDTCSCDATRSSDDIHSSDGTQPVSWKLFGKYLPEVTQNSGNKLTEDKVEKSVEGCGISPAIVVEVTGSFTPDVRKDVQVSSTTALILQSRPQGLPSKDPDEELHHIQLYQQMIKEAKRKEVKDAQQRKKQLAEQIRHEDYLSNVIKIWKKDILPNWETLKNSYKARELWWHGIPSCVRGKVWRLAIGNDLNLTIDLYRICLSRAKERLKLIEDWCGDTDSISSHMSGFSDHSCSREASVELIRLDVFRTFPQLCIFQKGGPFHETLQSLLGAYVCYRPDIGYVQGMSFVAAVMLLNMEVEEAFISFANLLNRPCQIAFFRMDESMMKSYFDTYEELFKENLPKLYEHFMQLQLNPDLYVIDWMFTLYAKSLQLDVASRVWDVFFRDGEEFLFRTALGILSMYSDIFMRMDFIHLAQFLTRLPDTLDSDTLFKHIEQIRMTVDGRCFQEVLVKNTEIKDTF